MAIKMEKILFRAEGEEPVEFYVLEQTRIGGVDYILVTDTEEDDGEALILRDVSQQGEEEALYEIVKMRNLMQFRLYLKICWRI